ncbi:MAG TPA: OmpA family protein [Sphingobacteriaceae bacterium]|nr:OmpA family protein [Sphingobacteriaceae bacterium]
MKYSTIKMAMVFMLISVFGLTEVAKAQEPTVFGGRSQYRTWSIGVNGGIHLPTTVFGPGGTTLHNGIDDPWDYNKVREFYGIQVRKQFSSWFGLQADVSRGRVMGWNKDAVSGADYNSAVANMDYAASLNGVFQLATIDFLRRENVVNFYATAGLGYQEFVTTQYVNNDGSGSVYRDDLKDCEVFVPIGVGFKFKLSDRVALNVGHTMFLMNSNELYGEPTGRKNRYSNLYGGLEFSLGSSDKADLTWHNPVAMLYDDLKDESLRNELEALKQRVSALEGTVDLLNRDEDGDGVSDRFDKCPGTPAGTVVDGSGCPIEFPEPVIVQEQSNEYANIQFEFDSSVLKTESYSILDRLSTDLRNSGRSVTLEGHASAEGSDTYNMQLSIDRANSVKTYLVNSGVAADKVITQGYGEERPIASNATEEGRVINRRVEIKL